MHRLFIPCTLLFIISSANVLSNEDGIISYVFRPFLGPIFQYYITLGTPKRTEETQRMLLKNIRKIYCEKTGGKIEIGSYSFDKAKEIKNGKAAIIFFGGNAQDTMIKNDFLYEIAKKTGIEVFTPNYPGFGGSDGGRWFSNTIDNSLATADSIVQQLQSEGYEYFFPVGWSFGSAIAAQMAKNYKTPMIALLSPFSSARNAVKGFTSKVSPSLLQSYLLSPFTDIALAESELNTGEILDNINHDMDVLIAHGKYDCVVNYSESENLNAIMESNTHIHPQFHTIRDGTHYSPLDNSTVTDLFIQTVNRKIDEIRNE